MRPGKAILFGVLGAASISLLSAVLRALGLPLSIEMYLGTVSGLAPGALAFGIGLMLHLSLGALFGLLYGALFERVWSHGGAFTGMLLSVLHAGLVGMLLGLANHVHPLVPERLPDPGPYFSGLGVAGVLSFFLMHVAYGAIMGGGYGHVASERQWAPTGRL